MSQVGRYWIATEFAEFAFSGGRAERGSSSLLELIATLQTYYNLLTICRFFTMQRNLGTFLNLIVFFHSSGCRPSLSLSPFIL